MEDIFTNGACDVFAKALKDRYGYKVQACVNRTGMLIHAFCQASNGQYVDADGIHDSLGFLKPYIGERKVHKIIEDYDVSYVTPTKYSDIYTEEIISRADILAGRIQYQMSTYPSPKGNGLATPL